MSVRAAVGCQSGIHQTQTVQKLRSGSKGTADPGNSGALMQLFVQDAGMIATGAQMLRWQVYTAAFGGVVLLLTVLFQATGKIIPSFLLSISRQGVVFLLALVVCVHLFQYQGVLMAQAVADILSAVLALGLLAASRDIIAKQ